MSIEQRDCHSCCVPVADGHPSAGSSHPTESPEELAEPGSGQSVEAQRQAKSACERQLRPERCSHSLDIGKAPNFHALTHSGIRLAG